MDHTTTTYTIPTTATTTNTTYVTSIPYANLHTDIHARTNMWAPLDTPSPREGRVWVDMCNKLLECFKEHFEHGDLDISEDEFWRIWNDG